MDHKQLKTIASPQTRFASAVGGGDRQILSVVQNPKPGIRIGTEMTGIIAWAIAVPSLVAAAVGRGLDSVVPVSYSWAVPLVVLGLIVGCINAKEGVAREVRLMREEQGDYDG